MYPDPTGTASRHEQDAWLAAASSSPSPQLAPLLPRLLRSPSGSRSQRGWLGGSVLRGPGRCCGETAGSRGWAQRCLPHPPRLMGPGPSPPTAAPRVEPSSNREPQRGGGAGRSGGPGWGPPVPARLHGECAGAGGDGPGGPRTSGVGVGELSGWGRLGLGLGWGLGRVGTRLVLVCPGQGLEQWG